MENLETLLGLVLVSGVSTLLGSVPVIFHRYLKEKQECFWESFGGGVMLSASVFSLFLPAWRMSDSILPLVQGLLGGVVFILISALLVRRVTKNISHQRAFLFIFVMALHNIPEGLSVGFDVAALGWEKALPLGVAIFIQNLPEGFVSSLSFILAGFSLPLALGANFVTAVIESASAIVGFEFARSTTLKLPLLLSFAGASMMTVVCSEGFERKRHGEKFSSIGFTLGLTLCALLDLFL